METFGGRPLETSLLSTSTRQTLGARSFAEDATAPLDGASPATGEQAPFAPAAAGQQLSGAASRHLSEALTAEAAANIVRQTDHLKRIVASDTTIEAQQHSLAESLLQVKSTNFNCVNNFNSLKVLLAENMFELILICVIVIYLVYYFSKISRVSTAKNC